MSHSDATREQVLKLLEETRSLIPKVLVDRLPPSAELVGEPAWHAFEHSLWALGEKIRQVQMSHPALRKDKELQVCILEVAVDRRAHRGRQPFVLLLGYKACGHNAARLAEELADPCVEGQVVAALYGMKANGHSDKIRPYLKHPKTWIRNEAKRYVAWDEGA